MIGDRATVMFPSPVRRWITVAILGMAALLSFTDRLIINIFADDVRRDLGLTDVSLSLLLGGGFALMYALTGVPLGRLADRANRRNIVAVAVALWCTATIGCGLARNFGELFAARVLVGLGEAALVPATFSIIVDSFPAEKRGRALGVLGIGSVLGSGIALGVGGALFGAVNRGLVAGIPFLADLAPWRTVLVLAGLPGVLAVPLILQVREPARHGVSGGQPTFAHILTVLRCDGGLLGRLCVSFGVVAAGDYGLMAWLPTILRRSFGMAPEGVGSLVGLLVAGSGLVGCVVAGWTLDWVARRHGVAARIRVMIAAVLLTLISGLALAVPQREVLLVAAVGWVLGSVAASVAGHLVLQEAVPNEMRGTTLALSYVGSAVIGMGCGPTLVPLLAAQLPGGLQVGLMGTCVAASLTCLALIVPASRARRGASVPTPSYAGPAGSDATLKRTV